ncbi:MAG: hypothetical protein FE041_01350 [Thermoplasmata archaeon]|nr:MAG: hypothetical protein FE041_01350 [Thermoplasmata archaeon]
MEEKEKGGEKTRRRGISAERIARRMLESRGFSIIATNHKIDSKGENIAEIDIIAEKDGQKYAVEVKSGKASLSAIRQAFANAQLAGYKPMIICKKSDEATREAAKKLGVEIFEFSEYHMLLEPEELESIVKKCMEEVMEEYGFVPSLNLDSKASKILRAIAESDDFEQAAKILKMKKDKLGKEVANLSKKGLFPSRSLSFRDLKKFCIAVLARNEIVTKLEKIEKDINEIKKKLGLI